MLFEAVQQVRKKNRLTGLCFGIHDPRKRNVHGDNFIHAEPWIHFEHLEKAAPEQTRSDHKNKRDGDLRRHDDMANALAAWRTGSCTPTPEAPPQIARCRARGGEGSESCCNRGGKQEREHKDGNTDGDAVQAREIFGSQRDQSRDACERAHYAEAATEEREKERFGKKLTDQAS